MSENQDLSFKLIASIIEDCEKAGKKHPHGKRLKSIKFKWADDEIVQFEARWQWAKENKKSKT